MSEPTTISDKVPMTGILYIGDKEDPWVLLRVPEDFKRSVFEAFDIDGMVYDDNIAHISVFDGDEVKKVGLIDELGQTFTFFPTSISRVVPEGWDDMEYAWFVTVASPELEQLREKYGLTPKLKGDHEFHITFGVKPKVGVQKSLSGLCLSNFSWAYKRHK